MHSAMLSIDGTSEVTVLIPASLAAFSVISPMQTAVKPQSS
ncbi:hypothetical protein CL3_26760 [butyrate-producing bacterium SM4/1]|nr:hypothetical protein CL3_26760 [butyrate-producing bacterium SM4/1]